MRRSWIVPFGLFLLLACAGCGEDGGGTDPDRNRDFRQDMMDFVAALSAWAREQHPGFIVIPQNGQGVYSPSDEPTDPIPQEYLDAIDGTGREDLFYGYEADNEATPAAVTAELSAFLDPYVAEGKVALVTDYIDTASGQNDALADNEAAGYVGFATDSRGLETIPGNPSPASPYNYGTSVGNVTSLGQIVNFLYIINPSGYSKKTAFLNAVGATNHDLVIVDAFDNDGVLLTAPNVNGLQVKLDSNARLAVSYMSIGEAESYRYYWDQDWEPGHPGWLDQTNPAWEGNYKVRYWREDWQEIIFGNDDAYLQKILDAGFDGVYLDIIDAYEYWEEKFD